MASTAGQQLLRIIRFLVILLATALNCISIVYFSIPVADTQQNQFDVIMVLGSKAEDDGAIAPLAESRVLEGIRQYRAGLAPRLLMTGGAVKNSFVEAQVMRQFALSQGVPASAVLIEDQSRNTIQSAYYASKIFQAHGWTSVLVVSSPTHIRRASLIFSHYPLAWRMDAAPWPPHYPLSQRLWLWMSEMCYTGYGRVFGFPNAGQYLPHTHFSWPRL